MYRRVPGARGDVCGELRAASQKAHRESESETSAHAEKRRSVAEIEETEREKERASQPTLS